VVKQRGDRRPDWRCPSPGSPHQARFCIPPLGHLGRRFTRTILNEDAATLAVMLPQIDPLFLDHTEIMVLPMAFPQGYSINHLVMLSVALQRPPI